VSGYRRVQITAGLASAVVGDSSLLLNKSKPVPAKRRPIYQFSHPISSQNSSSSRRFADGFKREIS
jgi:hypothetical protein